MKELDRSTVAMLKNILVLIDTVYKYLYIPLIGDILVF